MIATHSVPSADFRALATGRGGATVIARLAAAQASRRMLRLRLIVDEARNLPPDQAASLHRGYDLLTLAQEQDPVAAAKVLMYPSVGAWSASCLRGLRASDWSPGESAGMIGHLAAVAASAAASTGLEFQIDVPTRSGAILLPALGRAQFADDRADAGIVRGGSGTTQVIVGRHAVVVPADASSDQDGWHGLRRLRSTAEDLTIELVLDDLDPFRACYGFPVDDRLSVPMLADWRQRVDEAWSILVRLHPWYATAIQAGLSCLVPLRAGPGGKGVSTTSSDAFGACALSFPPDAQTLAVTLVHEFQHAKLGALHDLVPLHTATPDVRYYSPWRDDPRPLHGLLHGAYAYLGVTDVWRAQRRTSTRTAFDDFGFARWRAPTLGAVRDIERSGLLTSAGRALVAGMRSRLVPWQAEPVADMPRAAADMAIADHQISWRLRNLCPSRADVNHLAAAWLAGDAVAGRSSRAAVTASGQALSRSDRIELISLMLRDPAQLRGPDSGVGSDNEYAADRALARGDYSIAAGHYRQLLADDPDRADAWVGLALTQGPPFALRLQPELAYAVYRRIREISANAPDPAALADWLGDENVARA